MNITAFALASSLLLASAVVSAQPRPGAYFSSQQLAANQPAVVGSIGALNKPAGYLEVVSPTTYVVHRLPLTQVWGYATAAGKVYRLVGHQALAIEQHDSLVVYSRQRPIQQGRSTHTITEFFYSVGLDGDILPLTRRALRRRTNMAEAAPPPAPLSSKPS